MNQVCSPNYYSSCRVENWAPRQKFFIKSMIIQLVAKDDDIVELLQRLHDAPCRLLIGTVECDVSREVQTEQKTSCAQCISMQAFLVVMTGSAELRCLFHWLPKLKSQFILRLGQLQVNV